MCTGLEHEHKHRFQSMLLKTLLREKYFVCFKVVILDIRVCQFRISLKWMDQSQSSLRL